MYSAVEKHRNELWILKATNLELHKRDRNPRNTNHKRTFCFLRGPLLIHAPFV